MLVSLSLDNENGTPVNLHEGSGTGKRGLITAKGLVGVGTLRQSKRVRPSAHGSINETRFEEGGTIVVEGEVASNVSVADAVEEFRKITTPMLQTLDVGPALLKWEEVGGLKLQQLVKLDSEVEPILQGVAPRLVYQASFFSEDPRSYSQTQATVVGSGITGSAYEATWLKTTTQPTAVCVDATHVYWIDGVTKAIGRATLGSPPTEVKPTWITLANTPTALAINGSNVFWSWKFVGGETKNILGRAEIGGTGVVENWLAVTANVPLNPIKALAVNGSNIFYAWSNSGGIPYVGRTPLAGATYEESWLTLSNEVNSIAIDATYIYMGLSPNAIGRYPLAGGELKPQWLTNMATPAGLTVDPADTHVYWVGPDRNLGRATVAGTEPFYAFIPGLHSEPKGLTADSSHLYWGESTGYIARSKALAEGGPVGSACTVGQAGNRPAPLTFKVTGPVANPIVQRKSDGARISLRGTIASGNYVEISVAKRTVLLNGSSSLLAFLDAQNTNWSAFEAPVSPGTEVYELAATSATAAKLEVIYRSAYA